MIAIVLFEENFLFCNAKNFIVASQSQDSLKKQSKRKKNQAKKKQRGNELSKLVSDFDIAGIKFKSHLRGCLLWKKYVVCVEND
jgi:hypothetical protein